MYPLYKKCPERKLIKLGRLESVFKITNVQKSRSVGKEHKAKSLRDSDTTLLL